MTETVPLRPHYRYFAAVCMAATIACFVGAILYETYVGPIPEGANYGIWFAQILPPAAATASASFRPIAAIRRKTRNES